MAEPLLLVERQDRVCTLTINRPEKRNALTRDILFQLGEALEALREEGKIRCVIIRGAGEESFSSGFDLGRYGSPADERNATRDRQYHGTTEIAAYPYPVIAMIYGYAVGLGLELAVTCDLRIAANNAQFGIPLAKLGGVYGHLGIQKFLDLIGVAATKELMYTGRFVDATRAKEMGLINQMVPVNDLKSVTYAMAREVADNAPLSLAGTKLTVSKLLSARALNQETEAELLRLQAEAMRSDDLREGQRAFQEKRSPKFVGH